MKQRKKQQTITWNPFGVFFILFLLLLISIFYLLLARLILRIQLVGCYTYFRD